ncbi:MAG: hypothetical protein HYR55_01650 [Acidobacteria bacterium]|nr:hypothetical protein [Acidobacteriota bacterium]MBI3656340.1 hypothetical protein [Acidobacteriota bacterium]
MEKQLGISDLVTCRTSYPFAGQLRIAGEVGIILEFRKDSCRVFYESLFQNFWLPTECLRKVWESEAIGLPFLTRLRQLLVMVGASECELERLGTGYRLSAYTDDLPGNVLEEVRRYMDATLKSYAVHPFGMTKMILELDFVVPEMSA